MSWDALPWIIALGGGTGIGAGISALVSTVRTMRTGASAREDRRRADLVGDRDRALLRAEAAEAAAGRARRNETRAREYAADLRVWAIETLGVRRADLPPWPDMED